MYITYNIDIILYCFVYFLSSKIYISLIKYSAHAYPYAVKSKTLSTATAYPYASKFQSNLNPVKALLRHWSSTATSSYWLYRRAARRLHKTNVGKISMRNRSVSAYGTNRPSNAYAHSFTNPGNFRERYGSGALP